MTYLHILALQKISFYRKQGITILPGAERFILGNMIEFMYRELACAKSKLRVKVHFNWVLDYGLGGGVVDGFKSEEHPVVLINLMGDIKLMVQDPQMVCELLVSKNQSTDKTNFLDEMFNDLLQNSFIFSPGDAIWRAKRKACAHAFYKERLVHMMEVLRTKIEDSCDKWLGEIRKSETQSTQIDISVEFEKLFASNLVHIAFGEDINDQLFEMQVIPAKFGWTFATKMVNLQEAIKEVNNQIMDSYLFREKNPIGMVVKLFTGKTPPLTGYQR